jgi:ketosteroid isomerase-like protein
MKSLFYLSTICLFIAACSQSEKQQAEKQLNLDSVKQVLIATDQAFSDRSNQIGQQAAFLEYMDEHVTMLRPNSMPLVGKDTIRKIYAQRSDSSFTLTWSPLFADVSASGDLGYTYGTWLLETKMGEKEEGTYCSIWKQDSIGHWKFVMDVGNDGLKKPDGKD